MKITHVYVCDDDGEMEGMFDDQGELLAGWLMDDAHWRSEYMNGLLEALGHEIVRVDSCDARKKSDKALVKKVKEHCCG
jgi:hypothetical protein